MSEVCTYDAHHIYYQLRFSLQSSMLIGNGRNDNTDNDVLLNASGMPFIPGTTIAGMLREMAGTDADDLFGYALTKSEGNLSSLYVYDALLKLSKEQKWYRNTRDNVSLDEFKTARDQKKFDYEVVEPGIDFVGLIEISKNVPIKTKDKADTLLKRLSATGCSFGAKKSRGMGRMEVEIKKIEFDLSKEDDKKAWMEFHPLDSKETKIWENIQPIAKAKDDNCSDITLNIGVRLVGGISIRVYTTSSETVDYYTLRYKRDDENGEKAVLIPGTSWAGAFRARVREFIPEKELSELFGNVIENEKTRVSDNSKDTAPTAWRSKITFSETRITGGSFKQITRNAIDRFSGKTKDTALYGEETYYGGKGILTITLPGGDEYALARQAVGAAIADLHHGFLAVGGLTAIGRGLFEISQGGLNLNGVSIDINQQGWENALIRKLGPSSEVKNND